MEISDMRVLIVAEHASAKFGGEAFLPLHYFRLFRSRNIETWLLVHARTQTELEKLFPHEGDRLHFIPDTWLHQLLWQWGRRLPQRVAELSTGALMHLLTQVMQRRMVCRLVREHNIDIVHEPIPVSPKVPSLMFSVGAPVVIGPMNGGMEYPPAFPDYQGRLATVMVNQGRRFSNLFNRLLPGKLKAETLLVANERTRQALPAGVGGKVIELVENGVDLSVWNSTDLAAKQPKPTVRFVFVGRLVDWKAVDLLLEAFKPVADETGAVLEIIGNGAERAALEAQAARLELQGNVIFVGWLSQDECAVKLQQADALVLPSLYESGGAVVLEAMAMGLPAIATKWGGPTDYLDSSCGILVEPASREVLIQGLTEAMLKLARSPELRQQMGLAGQERIRQHFDWERKADQMLEIYRQTLATAPK